MKKFFIILSCVKNVKCKDGDMFRVNNLMVFVPEGYRKDKCPHRIRNWGKDTSGNTPGIAASLQRWKDHPAIPASSDFRPDSRDGSN